MTNVRAAFALDEIPISRMSGALMIHKLARILNVKTGAAHSYHTVRTNCKS
jgi:hypothetical protein